MAVSVAPPLVADKRWRGWQTKTYRNINVQDAQTAGSPSASRSPSEPPRGKQSGVHIEGSSREAWPEPPHDPLPIARNANSSAEATRRSAALLRRARIATRGARRLPDGSGLF